MRYKATAFDNREGGLEPLKVEIDTSEHDPDTVRQTAIDQLYEKMGPERNISNLVGFQMWTCGGITWYPITDQPPFCSELTEREQISRL